MSFSFVTTNNTGKVRALVGDAVEAEAVLSDEEIGIYLSINENDLYLSAAAALRAIASSKAKLAKKVRAGNYEEDTRQVGKDLLELAKVYETKAISEPAEATAEVIHTDFNYREILANKALRDELPD